MIALLRRLGRALGLLSLLLFVPPPVGAAARSLPDPRVTALEESRDPEAIRRQNSLISRRDRKRSQYPIVFPLFGRDLRLSGRITSDNQIEIERLLRFDLSDPRPETERAKGRRPVEDRVELDQRIELDLFYTLTDDIAIYLAGQAQWSELAYSDFSKEQIRSEFRRKEAWLYAGHLGGTPLGLQIGAQRFSDSREWWWDRDLDALRIRWDDEALTASFAVAEQLFPRDLQRDAVEGEDENLLRALVDIVWQFRENHELGFRALHQWDHSSDYDSTGLCLISDPAQPFISSRFKLGCYDLSQEDESDADLTWIGGSARGRFDVPLAGELRYWLDTAVVFGDETFYDFAGPPSDATEGQVFLRSVSAKDTHDVGGFGLDLGLSLQTRLPGGPILVGGYAFGSGRRNDSNERDRGFRQTGLHDNSDKFRGVATFKYYGELLDPELSNLEIWTAGLGFRFLDSSSIDFVYHRYRQHELSTEFRDVDPRRKVSGENRDIGDELDVILGIEEWQAFEIKSVLAVFWPGDAFGRGEGREAWLGELRFRYNF